MFLTTEWQLLFGLAEHYAGKEYLKVDEHTDVGAD